MRIRTAFPARLNAQRSVVDIDAMTEPAAQSGEFEKNCLTVLHCYAVRDAAAKASTREYIGWLDRILDVPGIETSLLTSIHGFLIAQGMIRFEFTGRSVGLQYQLSTQGRESLARESVYLSDDPRIEAGSAETDSIGRAA